MRRRKAAKPLVSGSFYLQKENIRAFYSKTQQEGEFEIFRHPQHARLNRVVDEDYDPNLCELFTYRSTVFM